MQSISYGTGKPQGLSFCLASARRGVYLQEMDSLGSCHAYNSVVFFLILRYQQRQLLHLEDNSQIRISSCCFLASFSVFTLSFDDPLSDT
jgi:hypothetical protein